MLLKQGLALRAMPRGGRRLCALRPSNTFHLPGTPFPADTVLPAETEPEQGGGAMLQPVAAYAGRLQHAAADASGVALRLRAGTLRAGSAAQPVALLMLEGPPGAVFDLAAALSADLPLLPAPAGLDEAARDLLRGSPAPARRGGPDLGEAGIVEEALSLALGHAAGALLAQMPRAHPGEGPEGVHQLRVATRRLRSTLRVFRPVLDGSALRTLDGILRDFARMLGEAREWDVFIAGLAAEITAALGPDRRWGRLLRAAGQRRLAAYGALREMLEGPGFRSLVWRMVRLAALREWQDGTGETPTGGAAAEAPALRPWAATILGKRHRKLLKGGRKMEDLSDEALHELRLEAKRLRYAAELFAPLWPGKASRRFLKRLAQLQEALGLSNDAVTARMRVASLRGSGGADAWAIGLAEGWALAKGHGTRKLSLKAWRRFAKCAHFWETA